MNRGHWSHKSHKLRIEYSDLSTSVTLPEPPPIKGASNDARYNCVLPPSVTTNKRLNRKADRPPIRNSAPRWDQIGADEWAPKSWENQSVGGRLNSEAERRRPNRKWPRNRLQSISKFVSYTLKYVFKCLRLCIERVQRMYAVWNSFLQPQSAQYQKYAFLKLRSLNILLSETFVRFQNMHMQG